LGLLRHRDSQIDICFSLDELNEHFINTSLTGAPDNEVPHSISILEPVIPFDDNAFHFKHITPELLTSFLRRSKSTSLGIDGISTDFIKKAGFSILPVILDIFNYSLASSTYPHIWKRSIITPIKKIKYPSSPKDFRPISLLCALSKVLENIVRSQVSEYLHSRNLLDPYQSGFRKHHSTQTALLRITDDIRQAIDQSMLTILVLFDFSKAFDRLNHCKLLSKMRELNFSSSTLNWFHSYLNRRQQAVKDSKGNYSSWLPTSHGVPQGSVLGPLLFSIYLLDLPKKIKNCKYMLYADDLQIYLHFPLHELVDTITKINQDVTAIASWTKENSLLLNTSKTKAIIIGNPRLVNRLDLNIIPRVTIDTVTIPYSDNIRNLGLHMNNNLTWHDHVCQVSNKINAILYQIKIHKHILSVDIKKSIISTLIFPHFDYCSLVFYDLPEVLNTKLQRLQNNCIRFIFSLRHDEHISPYRAKLKWITIKDRRKFLLGSFLYNLFHFKEPSYLLDEFKLSPPSRYINTRSSTSLLYCPSHRTTTFHNSFVIQATFLWNSISSDMKNASNSKIFKDKLYLMLSNSDALV
jgi:hypothetical protein